MTDILITIGVTILISALIFLLYKLLKYEIRKSQDEQMLLSDEIVSYVGFRALLERTIKLKQKKGNKPFTLMLIDLDSFQEIVDTFNKEEESFIMKYVSSHIKSALPEESIISQGLKPDQFFIYIPDSFDHSNIFSLAKSIKKEAERKVQILDRITIKKTVSIAIATYPLHGNNLDRLNQALEIALYMVKQKGGNDIRYYTEELAQDKESLDLYQELKSAKDKGEFIYHYQPIISTDDARIVYGLEALLRWNHPKRGLLSPGQFLHLAEQTGELDDIGNVGVEQALVLLTDLAQIHNIHDIVININVSPRQILNEETFTLYQRLIDKYRIKEGLIAIEIPDFSLYKTNQVFRRNLIKMKSLGFKIAIDISSTDYDLIDLIERFQIDMIKFSRNFYMLEDNYNFRKYYQMIIEFAHTKNKLLVSEGVETEAQFKELSEKGVGLAQGYYVSKPLSQETLIEYLLRK